MKSSTPTVIADSSTSKSPWWRSRTVALAGGADAQAGHGAGDVLQVPGEVLAAEALLGALDGLDAAAGDHGVAQQFGHAGLVDHGRDAAHVVDLRLGAVQVGDLVDRRDARGRAPAARPSMSRQRTVPESSACCGMTFGAWPDSMRPQVMASPARAVEAAADQRGHVGDDAGGGGDQVGREVGAGGVAARAVEGDLQPVAGGGDGTLAQPDPPGVHPGVAVHGDDRARRLPAPRT